MWGGVAKRISRGERLDRFHDLFLDRFLILIYISCLTALFTKCQPLSIEILLGIPHLGMNSRTLAVCFVEGKASTHFDHMSTITKQ